MLDEFSIPLPFWTPAIQGYPRLLLIRYRDCERRKVYGEGSGVDGETLGAREERTKQSGRRREGN